MTSRQERRAGTVLKARRGYTSPQIATIDGIPQVVLVSGVGAIGVKPADGSVLWKHARPATESFSLLSLKMAISYVSVRPRDA